MNGIETKQDNCIYLEIKNVATSVNRNDLYGTFRMKRKDGTEFNTPFNYAFQKSDGSTYYETIPVNYEGTLIGVLLKSDTSDLGETLVKAYLIKNSTSLEIEYEFFICKLSTGNDGNWQFGNGKFDELSASTGIIESKSLVPVPVKVSDTQTYTLLAVASYEYRKFISIVVNIETANSLNARKPVLTFESSNGTIAQFPLGPINPSTVTTITIINSKELSQILTVSGGSSGESRVENVSCDLKLLSGYKIYFQLYESDADNDFISSFILTTERTLQL